MKYWFFDGNDVIGPFAPKELLARAGFSNTSLVCPEKFSENEDSWKPASSFSDFSDEALLKEPPLEAEPNAELLQEEMNTLLKEREQLEAEVKDPHEITQEPNLQLPKRPNKPGPIEDYFNNIKGEDLGNILGIPDPNENSDMSLARALETQFGATNPPTDKEIRPEEDPFNAFTRNEEDDETDEFLALAEKPKTEKIPAAMPKTAASLPQKQPVKEEGPVSVPISNTAETEELVLTLHGELPPQEEKTKEPEPAPAQPQQETQPSAPETAQETEPAENSAVQLPVLDQPGNDLPQLPEGQPQQVPASTDLPEPPAAETNKAAPQPAEPQELVSKAVAPTTKAEGTAEPLKSILEGELDVAPAQKEIPEPLENVPVEPQLNQVRTRLKQTPEIEAFLTKTQHARISPVRKKMKVTLCLLVALLACGAALLLNHGQNPVETPEPAVQQPAPEETPQYPSAKEILSPKAPQQPTVSVPAPKAEPSPADKALALVQNYPLSNSRGTIASYFDRLYRTQLAQGYSGAWSAEPLHKNTYIVKYRLTKTRTEPIVYVFQADVARGKLTGALNNVTLDLVGKI